METGCANSWKSGQPVRIDSKRKTLPDLCAMQDWKETGIWERDEE